MNKSLKNALLILCLIFSFEVLAKGATNEVKYPPYPDVWGYDILDDMLPNCNTSPEVSRMSSGEYIIEYISKPKIKNPKVEDYDVCFIHFFENKKNKFNIKSLEANEYLKKTGVEYPSGKERFVELKNGKIINTQLGYKKKYYYPHNILYNSFVGKSTAFSDKNYDYKLSGIGIRPIFDEQNNVTPYKFVIFNLFKEFIKFKDNTFIVFNRDEHLFIRFDKDFKTKFKAQHTVKLDENRELKSNFYVLPYSKIEYFYDLVVQDYTGELSHEDEEQYLNTKLLDYLYDLEQNNNI